MIRHLLTLRMMLFHGLMFRMQLVPAEVPEYVPETPGR